MFQAGSEFCASTFNLSLLCFQLDMFLFCHPSQMALSILCLQKALKRKANFEQSKKMKERLDALRKENAL